MDITALLTATDGAGKAGHIRPSKTPADGAFAAQLSLAAHSAGLVQLLSTNHTASKLDAQPEGDLPDKLAALAQRLSDGIEQEASDALDQDAALALLEGVLDETNVDALGEAPLAALEALLDANMQRLDSLPERLELDTPEESALLAEVRQRMALIDAAGRPPTDAGQGPAKQQPGAELAVQQVRVAQASEGTEMRPIRTSADALLLDPAAAREVRPAGRDALTEITQQALRSAAQSAPSAGLGASNPGVTAQPGMGQSQQGTDMPLFAALNGRAEATAPTSAESPGLLAPTAASAQGTTASPQPLGQPLASPTGATLAAPIASQQWQQQLGQQLVNLTQRGDQRVELRLNPAELGPLSVSLKVGESGAQAQFLSANAQVRAAVEQAIPQLREALEEQGISLSEAMVGEHAGGQQGEMQFANGGDQQASSQRNDGENVVVDSDDPALAASVLSLDGRVDLYA